jgi:hypothetical protein
LRSAKLEGEGIGNYYPVMFAQNVARKLMAAMLALAVFISTAPAVQALASANPCDCPSMQMQDQGTAYHAPPAKQQNAPCNDMQNCICSLSCGMSVSLSQQSLPLPSFSAANKLAWHETNGGSSLSTKPAIPPPIPVV